MTEQLEPVVTVDCHYIVPEHAASYLLIEDQGAAFIDVNTSFSVPYLLDALEQHGLGPGDVKYVIPTHLHLDHAGGMSALIDACPNAVVLCHPRGVRHFVDPSRLVAGAKAVYGEDEFDKLYGAIKPINAARIRSVEDNETLQFGNRALTFLHTRGHANHHVCIHDGASNGVFTGDAFGVEYKKSRTGKRPLLVCSAAPTDFDPDEARKSIHRIMAVGKRVFVAHYGEVADVRGGAEAILNSISQMEAILNEAVASPLSGGQLEAFCQGRVRDAIHAHFDFCGTAIDAEDWPLFETHARINAQGIALVAEKRRAGK